MNLEVFVLEMYIWVDLVGGFGFIKFIINIMLGLEIFFFLNKIIYIGIFFFLVCKVEFFEKKILELYMYIGKYVLNCYLLFLMKEWIVNINSI